MKQLQNKMKHLKNKTILLVLFTLCAGMSVPAQDTEPREMILNLVYYMPNNMVPYLKLTAKEKVNRQFIGLKNIVASVYIGEESEAGLIEKVKTNDKGEAVIFIPASFKSSWDSPEPVNFYAVTEADTVFKSTSTELQVTKAKIEIDTLTEDDIKYVKAKVTQLKDGAWIPAPEVDLKISVKRSLSNLPVGSEFTYTTDSSGIATAQFERDSLYGDDKGDLILVARTEDNDVFGNIRAEKLVDWGKAPVIDHSFFSKRSLWATRFRTPFWLLGLAYVIIGSVWGTLIYLIVQIIKIRKLGKIAG